MEKVTIGADPEFVIKLPGKNDVLPADAVTKFKGLIGTDAVDDLIEIRPNPSTDVFKVLGNIRYALRFLLDKSPKLQTMEFIAGHKGGRYAIGGHIHIGRVSKKHWPVEYEERPEDEAPSKIIYLLDKLLYDGLHKMISDRINYNYRVRSSYGQRHSWREGHSSYIVEYRTPPSWLVSPTLAFFYLCLAKIGGLISLNQPELTNDLLRKKAYGVNLLKNVASNVESIRDIYAEPDVRKLVGLIQDIKLRQGQTRDWHRDFKKAWGL